MENHSPVTPLTEGWCWSFIALTLPAVPRALLQQHALAGGACPKWCFLFKTFRIEMQTVSQWLFKRRPCIKDKEGGWPF